MKNNLFFKILAGSFVLMVLFSAVSVYSLSQIKEEDAVAFVEKIERESGSNINIDWDIDDGTYQAHDDKWEFNTDLDEIQIKLISGKFEIQSGDQPNAEISVRGRLQSENSPSLLDVAVDGTKLTVEPPKSGASKHIQGVLRLPKDFKGKVKIKAVSADIQFSASGSVPVEIETVSGEIDVKNTTLGSSEFKTISGDIEIDATIEGNTRVQTVSGDAEVKIKNPEKTKLKVSTLSGDIENPYTGNSTGEFEIQVETQSGDISIQ